jgi:hypothetical protein
MLSLHHGLGELDRVSNRLPSIDPFIPWLFFSGLAMEFSASPSLEDSCFVLPSCLDGDHQGASIAHETTHDEYIHMKKFIPMWHGPGMESHMMPTPAHEFTNHEKYPWHEPSNGLYLA